MYFFIQLVKKHIASLRKKCFRNEQFNSDVSSEVKRNNLYTESLVMI